MNNPIPHPFRFRLLKLLLFLYFVAISPPLQAAPGDIIFSDNFERSTLGSAWTVNNPDGGDAGIGSHTAQSGSRSLYTRWDAVSVTSQAINLSAMPAAEFSLWIREGRDDFSEDPEAVNEDLMVEFLNSSGTWVNLIDYPGNAFPGGNIQTPAINLPASALHAGFRLRIRQTGGHGDDYDYYHLDDIAITERASTAGGFCDDFESGFGNWQVSAIIGDAGISSHTSNSPSNSLYLRYGTVSVTSVPVDMSAGNGEFTYWVRRGADSFSENPDSGENLAVEYFNASSNWVVLDTFQGDGTPGEQFNITHALPADAQHNQLRLRFTMAGDDGAPYDYWHVDDVCIHTVAPPQALAYYALDEDNWGTVSDSSGNGNDGTTLGSVTPENSDPAIPGAAGTCGYAEIPFNNSSAAQDAIDTGIDVNSEIGNAGTIDFWYKSNERWNGNRGDRQLFDASATFSGQKYFSLMLQNNSRLRFALEDTADSDFQVETGNNNFSADTWVHIAATWDLGANRLWIYINGALENSSAISSNGQLGDVASLYFGDNRSSYLARSTVNSANGSLDEIRIYNRALNQQQIQDDMNATHPCSASQVDHYVISYSGQGVTCEAEPVEIISHDSTHAEMAPGTGTIITLSAVVAATGSPAPGATWSGTGVTDLGNGQAQYIFTGTETRTTLHLRHTSEQTLNIDVIDSNGITEHSGNANEADSDLVFSDTAFRFYADGTVSAIGTQIAGKDSDINPGAQTLTLRAVQTNTLTGACESRLNGTQTVEMAFQCIDPASCKIAGGVTINTLGIADNPASGVSSYANVDLDFGTTGTAAFVFNYADAGQIQLHARKVLPAIDPEPEVTLTGASNLFTVKPAGLCVQSTDANPECPPPYHDCTRFTQAGRNFNLSVSAVAWQTGGESDSAFCSGNPVTPNFQMNDIAISHNLIAPVAGVAGNIATGSIDIATLDDGEHTLVQSVTEVGAFSFTATALTYFGEIIPASTSDVIGRFYPEDFMVTVNDHGTMAPACGSFTYTGQPMGYATNPELSVTARNAGGATTQNYTGDFSKLLSGNGSLVSFSAPSADATQLGKDGSTLTALTATLNDNLVNIVDNGGGTLTYPLSALDEFTFILDGNAEIGPYASDIDLPLISVIDGDGVTDDGEPVTVQPVGTEIRFGRLVLDDAYGPQTDDLVIPVRAEYFDGSGFIDNTDDYCTLIDLISPFAAIGLDNWQENLGSGETAVINSSGLLAGSGEILLSAPGMGADNNDGSVDLTLDLSVTAPPQTWLRIDKEGDGTFTDDPVGTASFGMFRGDDRFLYWRETQ